MKQENLSKVVKLRHELHRHPELSMEETFTKEHLMEFVEENTNLEIVNKGRWFYVYKKGTHSTMSPIAFRADFVDLLLYHLAQSEREPCKAHFPRCFRCSRPARRAAYPAAHRPAVLSPAAIPHYGRRLLYAGVWRDFFRIEHTGKIE